MRRKPSRIALAATSILCSLILAACNCAPTLRYVSVAPTSATIFAAEIVSTSGETTTTTLVPCTTQQFAATGYYSDGSQKDISSVAGWSSSNTGAATISAAGLASAASSVKTAGDTSVITATAGGASAAANLAVNVLTAITVTPAGATVPLGSTQQYTATGTFNAPGSTTAVTMDLTSQVAWSVAGGTTSTDGSTSSNNIASIGTATGLLTTNNPFGDGTQGQGTTRVIATLCTLTGSTNVTVGPPVGKGLQITPSTTTIAIGQTVDFTAAILNTDGSTTPVTPPVTWTSGTTTVASIISQAAGDGLATGLTTGSSTITATTGTSPNVLTGTATLTVAAAVARFAYVSNGIDQSISGYATHAANGGYTPFGKIPGVAPQQVLVHPSGNFLYSVDGNTSPPVTITAYGINPTSGALTATGLTGAITNGSAFNHGVIDPSGRWLYVTDFVLNEVFAFSINQTTGALTSIETPVNTGTGPIDILVAPNSKYLYVINNGGNTVSVFSISAAGLISPMTGSAAILNAPQSSAIDPTGTYLFVPNSGNNSITPFAIGVNGSLTAGTAFTVAGAHFLNGVAVDPTSKFIYAVDAPTDNSAGNLYAFNITAGGGIGTALTGAPYPIGNTPTGVAVDPTGKIVAVANTTANTLSVFTAAADGSLTPDRAVETGSGPTFPVFAKGTAEAASGVSSVVAANSSPGTLSDFTISSTGALTLVNSTAFTSVAGNSQIASIANGNAVFTGSASAKELAGYTVNPASPTATFTAVHAPYVLPGAAGNVVVDASGAYVYVADATNNTIAAHSPVDLSLLTGSPYSVPGGVLALAADQQTTLVYALGTNAITPILTQTASGGLLVQTALSQAGTWVAGAVSPSGKFLAAVDSTANKILVFSITAVMTGALPSNDGQLTPIGTGVSIPGAMTVSSVAFDPLGRFLVVTDSKANTVTPFTISSSGTLTAGTALTTPTGAGQATFDATGSWLFVSVFGNPSGTPVVPGGVQVYSVASGGALTAVGTPVTGGNGTTGVAVLNAVK